jgi:hypothetical protein
MSSETVDWLKKVSKNKAKVSFDLDDEEEGANETYNFVKPKANAIKNIYSRVHQFAPPPTMKKKYLLGKLKLY